MQNTFNRKGYLGCSITVTSTATRLKELIEAQIPNFSFAGSYREVQLQVDPETAESLACRIGDGSLGTTISGVVQKGVTLLGGGAQDTYRVSGANAIYAIMMYLQAVSDPVILNCQFFEE